MPISYLTSLNVLVWVSISGTETLTLHTAISWRRRA